MWHSISISKKGTSQAAKKIPIVLKHEKENPELTREEHPLDVSRPEHDGFAIDSRICLQADTRFIYSGIASLGLQFFRKRRRRPTRFFNRVGCSCSSKKPGADSVPVYLIPLKLELLRIDFGLQLQFRTNSERQLAAYLCASLTNCTLYIAYPVRRRRRDEGARLHLHVCTLRRRGLLYFWADGRKPFTFMCQKCCSGN